MCSSDLYGMTANLIAAGGQCDYVFDESPVRIESFKKQFPDVAVASSLEQLLQDQNLHLIIAAAVPSERGPLGLKVMDHGKHYFTDKCPFTTLDQLAAARQKTVETDLKYMCCYSERLENEAAEFAVELINSNVIGQVIQVIGTGPHRLNAPARPGWFFEKEKYGGIICDIGSHQAEQFLTYTASAEASVNMARVENFAHPEFPELEDFGEFSLTGSSGASGYFRLDWFTPDGLRTWGDGRTFILGSNGYIELRKYVDVAQPEMRTNNVYIVTSSGEEHHCVTGKVGFPFFGKFILDCLDGTELAMTQQHCFMAAEICLQAQAQADQNRAA